MFQSLGYKWTPSFWSLGMGGGKEGCDTISTTAKTSKPLPKLQPKPIAKKVGIIYLDLQTCPEDKRIFCFKFSTRFPL